MITLLDTVTPGAIGRLASTSPDAVAGYADGRYADIAALERDYPNHHHLAIAVSARDDADCLDVETGDATPGQTPGWVRRQHARGIPRPVVYANRSTMPAVRGALQAAGIGRASVRLWAAAYATPPQPTLEGDEDAHQYTDHWEGRNVDASVCRDDFFNLPAAPKTPKPRQTKSKTKPHPKVVGSGAGATLGLIISAVLHAAGVAITPAEASAISTLTGLITGWITPNPKHA